MTTNRSHLASTVVNARAAALIAREWGGAVSPQALTRLEKFTYVASVTLGPLITPPFLVRGVPVEELWGSEHDPGALRGLEDEITRNLRRRPIATTLSELESLDERILAHLDRQTIERAGGAGPFDAPALRPGFVRMDPASVPRGDGGSGGTSWR